MKQLEVSSCVYIYFSGNLNLFNIELYINIIHYFLRFIFKFYYVQCIDGKQIRVFFFKLAFYSVLCRA